MIQRILLLFIACGLSMTIHAQEFLTPSFTFSSKKISKVTLKDGTLIEGKIKDIDRKKGLIEYVKIKDETGKKHKLDAEKIAYMYLMPSGWDKMVKASSFLNDVQKWGDDKLEQDLLNQGYVYFENSKVKVKKKERILLMQLLNPSFSGKVKVYHDPLAKETMSVGVGGFKVAGGDAKSYYVKVDDEAVAYRLKKKDYKDGFDKMWNACDKVKSTYPKMRWTDLSQHIVKYTTCE